MNNKNICSTETRLKIEALTVHIYIYTNVK